MSIRKRLLISMSLLLVGLIAVTFAVSHSLLTSDFSEIERNEVRRDMGRVMNALEKNIADLDIAAMRCAQDNDTIPMLDTMDRRYIARELSDDLISKSKLDVVAFITSDGKPIFIRSRDRFSHFSSQLPLALRRCIIPGDPLEVGCQADGGLKGIVSDGASPVLMAARPVTAVGSKKPIRGFVVIGKYLDSRVTGDIQAYTGVSVSIVPTRHAHAA